MRKVKTEWGEATIRGSSDSISSQEVTCIAVVCRVTTRPRSIQGHLTFHFFPIDSFALMGLSSRLSKTFHVMEKLVEENWANFPKAKEVESEQLCLFSRLRVSSTTSHQFLLPVPPSFPSSSAAVLVSQYLLIQMTNKKRLNYLMTSLRYIKRRWSTVLFLPSPSMAGYSLLSRKKAINIKASKHYLLRRESFHSSLAFIALKPVVAVEEWT